jgi:hypothetical protein
MLSKERAYAQRYGKDIDDVILELIYTADESGRTKVSAWKGWRELTMPKITEGGETDKALGPKLFLPEHRPPELSVVPGGKS